jgi:valine dehydrogenase (NAD+)
VLNDQVVQALQAQIVCGAANNQLAHPGIDKLLHDRGIRYAPDFVVNAGGLIQVADEIDGYCEPRARARAGQIFETTHLVLARAEQDGIPPGQAADRHAEQRIAAAGRRAVPWLPGGSHGAVKSMVELGERESIKAP